MSLTILAIAFLLIVAVNVFFYFRINGLHLKHTALLADLHEAIVRLEARIKEKLP